MVRAILKARISASLHAMDKAKSRRWQSPTGYMFLLVAGLAAFVLSAV